MSTLICVKLKVSHTTLNTNRFEKQESTQRKNRGTLTNNSQVVSRMSIVTPF